MDSALLGIRKAAHNNPSDDLSQTIRLDFDHKHAAVLQIGENELHNDKRATFHLTPAQRTSSSSFLSSCSKRFRGILLT